MVQTFVGSTKKVLTMVQVTRTMEPSWERIQRSLLLNYNLTICWITITIIHFAHHHYYPWLQLAIFLLAIIIWMQVFVLSIQKMIFFFLNLGMFVREKNKKNQHFHNIVRNVDIGHIILILCLHSNFLLGNVCLVMFLGIILFVLVMDNSCHCKWWSFLLT
jgi:small-conductance mechanosensitive channel